MEQFIRNKIISLTREREDLEELARTTGDLMLSGLVQQEIKRNEGLTEIYRGTAELYGWPVSEDDAGQRGLGNPGDTAVVHPSAPARRAEEDDA